MLAQPGSVCTEMPFDDWGDSSVWDLLQKQEDLSLSPNTNVKIWWHIFVIVSEVEAGRFLGLTSQSV